MTVFENVKMKPVIMYNQYIPTEKKTKKNVIFLKTYILKFLFIENLQ